MKREPLTAFSCFLLAASLACGSTTSTSPSGTGTGNPPPTGPNDVTVENNSFSPAARTVSPGTTVNWTWDTCTSGGYGGGTSCVSHNVTFDDGVASSTQGSGTYSRAFPAAGTYKYHCTIHGTSMSGTVTVQ
jgi:plastocyanin